MDFDPYYNWLGIPPAESAGGGPNHYRLLGLNTFEENADAISNAADRVMAHLRTYQTGKHSALSQRLLSEVAQARVCLLDAEKKAAYDHQLLAQVSLPEPAIEPASLPATPPASPLLLRSPKRLTAKKPARQRRRSRTLEVMLTIGGLLAMIGVAIALGYVWRTAPIPATSSQRKSQTAPAEGPDPKLRESTTSGHADKRQEATESKIEPKPAAEEAPAEPRNKSAKPKTPPKKKKPSKKPAAVPKDRMEDKSPQPSQDSNGALRAFPNSVVLRASGSLLDPSASPIC